MKTITKRIYLLIFALVTMVIGVKAASVPYAELINANDPKYEQYTLYFKYGELPESTSNDWIYDLSVKNESGFAYWHGFSNFISKVVFDASFSSAQVESTDWWFSGCTNLTSIEGMEYFDASKVHYARYMFYNCTNLTRVDMSFFKPREPREFQEMFSGCNSLKSVDLSGVDFTQILTCYKMFSGCWKLETVELGGSGYTNSSYLWDCRSMFEDCKLLTTIYCPYALQLKSTGNTTSAYMFKNCLNLQGAVKYQLGNDDISYANPETGYFTIKEVPLDIKLAGQDVTNINCGDLTAISGVTGTASYDPDTKTLYLEDASITEKTLSGGYAIKTTLDTLRINVTGDCNISSSRGTGISANSRNVVIGGTGTLNINAGTAGIVMYNAAANSLDIDDEVTVNVEADTYGMVGRVRRLLADTIYTTTLKVGGENSKLSVKGNKQCFYTLGGFSPADGYKVTSPSHTAFDPASNTFCRVVATASGSGKIGTGLVLTLVPVAGAAVVIEKPYILGDVNGDGSITMADANMVVNYFLATDPSSIANFNVNAADVNGDKAITMADANQIVNIFLGQ